MTTSHAVTPNPNRLIHEQSLYLRQHAYNPVDWYPWGEEALEQARQQNKPILLSIGYSACHWCHVLAHESFEDPDTAAIMNKYFINIKVDREERPDLDALYMSALVAMRGQGGWPLNVFLFPDDGTPFYGGTYFPPEEKAARYGIPGFKQILLAVAQAYRERGEELRNAGQQVIDVLQRRGAEPLGGTYRIPLAEKVLDKAFANLERDYDAQHGGFGKSPKFPQPMVLEFLLRYTVRSGNEQARTMLQHTLDQMARGGMYDQLGGGFHRYSVDQRWLVPHFEKMLYDNALLARLYVEACQVTSNPFYRRVAEETLDYIVREMRHPDGGFYSTQDADSEGKEGTFFLWTATELYQLLGENAAWFTELFGVTEAGNFEGKNILHMTHPLADVASTIGMPTDQFAEMVDQQRKKLWEAREQRVKPARDEKVLTAWNGMALRAFATASAAFNRADYLEVAQQNADFLWQTLRRADGRVMRSWSDPKDLPSDKGPAAWIPGYLEDYALFADGLLALYQVDGNARWLHAARTLVDGMHALFWDDDLQGFYDTAADHEQLIIRPRDVDDNATPSGNSVAVAVLLHLAALTSQEDYQTHAQNLLDKMLPSIQQIPYGYGQWLCATDFALGPVREVVLAGDPSAEDMQALMEVVHRPYWPHLVIGYIFPDEQQAGATPDLPLFADRGMLNGKATAYVCEGSACKMPVTDAEALRQQLVGKA
jgi:hypothetical protein